MSRHRLHAQIARATGESLRTIREQGFSLLKLVVPLPDPPAQLCLACPGCGSDIPLSADEGTRRCTTPVNRRSSATRAGLNW